ncbi:elongation factor G C-terminus domain-containing protein [Toxoplasma gondii ARI]|uniref:Elongation factor G C-terminus domain-containing protein n=1 Tax=Toxoplasma gondii ARI TaxID=1074872 RepID=A0A139Y9E0_TOXGO|nr:elongation factor G C-terminus domain-containing protein [Toxoplasma gondii ARI]
MDRDGVDMDACLEAVRQRLNAWPLQVNAVYQVPRAVWSNSNSREKRKTHSVAPQAIIDLTDFCTALYPPVSSFLDASSLPVFYSPPPHVLASLLSSAPSSSPSSSPSVFPSSPPSSPTWAWWNDPRISADVKNRRERLVEDLSLLDDAFEQCVAAGTASCMQSAACGSLPDPRDAQAQRGERGERGETEATASELLAFRDEMRAALRRTALQNLAVPVLFGSSFFSRGVTQLLDGISAFLPSPLDRPPLPLVASTRKAPTPPSRPSCFSSCGRFLSPDRQAAAACVAFKVYPDGKGGRIAFVRVLAGRITPRTSLFNSTKNCLESSSSSLLQLFRVKADAYHSVAALSSGDIGAIRGLSAVTAGDVLHLASAPSFVLPLLSPFHRPSLCSSTNAASPLFPPPETPGHTSAASPFSPSAPFSPPFSVRSSAPFSSALHSLSPVCFTSVACRNAREETEMAEALAAASLSDVALKFEKDEAGKFVLWGLGELHLQVIQARLRDEFGLSVEFGPLEVAYRELLLHPVRGSLTYSPSSSSAFDIAFSLLPLPLTPPEQRLSALLSSREDPGFVALCRAAEEVEAIPFPSLSSSLTHQTHLLFSLSPEAADQLQTLEDAQKNARRAKCPGKTPRIASLSSSTHSAPSPSSSLLSESVLLRAIQEAAYHASGAGPLLSYPLDFLHIRLESVAVRDGSAQLSPSSLSAASAQLLRLLLRTGRGQSLRQAQGEETESFQDASGDPEALRDRVAMLEPVMHMEICSPSQSLGPLMRDLTQQRRASIVSIAAAGKESATGEESHEDAKDWRQFQISGEEDSAMMELHAVVPLRCMESYSSVLRALSHGQAHFQMRPLGYGRVSALDEETLLAEAGMVPSSF